MSDEDCSFPTTYAMSYVAYKEDFCFHLRGSNVTRPDGSVGDIDATMTYHGGEHPETLYGWDNWGNPWNYTFGGIQVAFRLGTECNSGMMIGNYSLPTDLCIHDGNGEEGGNNNHAQKHVDSATMAAFKEMQTEDFAHDMQNQNLYQSYKRMKKQREAKKVEDGGASSSGGSWNDSWSSWSSSSSSGSWDSSPHYEYYAEYELFVNNHDYGYKWVNAPHINVPMVPTAAPTQSVGWASEKYYVGDTVVIESARRTGLCLPFYSNETIDFHYVAVCGDGKCFREFMATLIHLLYRHFLCFAISS